MPRPSHLISLAVIFALASLCLSAPTASDIRAQHFAPRVSKLISSPLLLKLSHAQQLRFALRRTSLHRSSHRQNALRKPSKPRNAPHARMAQSLLRNLPKHQISRPHHPLRRLNSGSHLLPLESSERQFGLDPCRVSTDCEPPRICADFDEEDLPLCEDESGCRCLSVFECDDTDDCFENTMEEVCVEGEPLNLCISKEYALANPEGLTIIPPTGGFTGDNCMDDTNCRGDRTCEFSDDGEFVLCDGGSDCLCFPSDFVDCEEDLDCEIGEKCRAFDENSFCVSTAISDPTPEPSPGTTTPITTTTTTETTTNTTTTTAATTTTTSETTTVPTTTTTATTTSTSTTESSSTTDTSTTTDTNEPPAVLGGGLSGDRCDATADCSGGRGCREIDLEALNTDGEECSDDSTDCVCLPGQLQVCVTSNDCQDGEICAVAGNTEQNLCFSEIAVNNEEVLSAVDPAGPVVSEVCIDAEALSHLPQEELVFDEHAVGRVLCDGAGSCATRGHIVVFEGRAMMMATYCEMVGCKGRIIRVNSPRYLLRRRIKSRTEGLEYTAFAARWETKVEERVLTAAVRFGL